jgi:hypothetical protein
MSNVSQEIKDAAAKFEAAEPKRKKKRHDFTDAERREVEQGMTQWMSSPYLPGGSPAVMLASPAKQSLLAGLTGTAAGGIVGSTIGSKLEGTPATGKPTLYGGIAGGLSLGALAALLAAMRRNAHNQSIIELMHDTENNERRASKALVGLNDDSPWTSALSSLLKVSKCSECDNLKEPCTDCANKKPGGSQKWLKPAKVDYKVPYGSSLNVSAAGEGKKAINVQPWSSYGKDTWENEMDNIFSNSRTKLATMAIQALTTIGDLDGATKIARQVEKLACGKSCKKSKKRRKKASDDLPDCQKKLMVTGTMKKPKTCDDQCSDSCADKCEHKAAGEKQALMLEGGLLGALLGGARGYRHGHTAEGIGRGAVRGALTGGGLGIGAGLGAGLGALGGHALGGTTGGAIGALGLGIPSAIAGTTLGWKGSGRLLGPASWERDKTKGEDKGNEKEEKEKKEKKSADACPPPDNQKKTMVTGTKKKPKVLPKSCAVPECKTAGEFIRKCAEDIEVRKPEYQPDFDSKHPYADPFEAMRGYSYPRGLSEQQLIGLAQRRSQRLPMSEGLAQAAQQGISGGSHTIGHVAEMLQNLPGKLQEVQEPLLKLKAERPWVQYPNAKTPAQAAALATARGVVSTPTMAALPPALRAVPAGAVGLDALRSKGPYDYIHQMGKNPLTLPTYAPRVLPKGPEWDYATGQGKFRRTER